VNGFWGKGLIEGKRRFSRETFIFFSWGKAVAGERKRGETCNNEGEKGNVRGKAFTTRKRKALLPGLN